jgi:hypothetical protein
VGDVVTDPKAIDRSLDVVERRIEKLREKSPSVGDPAHERLQRLYARRYELQKRQFKALQRKIKRMPK